MEFGFIEYLVYSTLNILKEHSDVLVIYFPMLMVVEIPLLFTTFTGIVFWYRRAKLRGPLKIAPSVSCIITCYGEGDAIKDTILTLCEQIYPGNIQIIPVIDGAKQNADTYQAALDCLPLAKKYHNRTIDILPKWQRGGRVSTLNAGLYRAKGEIVINVDGDTSFDNSMVYEMMKEFEDPNVPAVGGSLRVRNWNKSMVTRMQALEYMISMQAGKTGLAEWNLINNISGAFGAFRRKFLQQIGGWDTHSAEDLDLTVRIKQYMTRHPNIRIPFATKAIGHTDAPETWSELFWQRMRWDGDLLFLYLRKHPYAFSPKLLGFKGFVFTLIYGVLQNILMPLLVVLFNIYLITYYNMELFLAMIIVQFFVYLVLSLIHFFIFLFAISERPRQDMKIIYWLLYFPFPIYTLVTRVFSAIAILNEVFRRGHEESNMAPWWVLKKGKKF
ncbi:glycosyltransferase family 2 protein [Thalassotalea crassostreae]|uniref:glycosyltransferase family 2 protein n=1 Tax=Thalassotalea crassostreae TaxID=1763536 RepID=UPI000838A21B|nr:glycosyltransferase [Thalassotalea crassostreae]